MSERAPRVGIVGYAHEVNALAASVTLDVGRNLADTIGGLAAAPDVAPLVARLRELRDVEIVELPVWEISASGPLVADDFGRVLTQIVTAIDTAMATAGPLDALVVLGHGAGASTDDRDVDGTLLGMVRGRVGERTPIVTVLDFHANLSAAMVAACDVIVGYRTNPHVDIADRLREAAEHVDRLLDGATTAVAWCRLPLVVPQIGQLTTGNEPFGRAVDNGQRLARTHAGIRNVSVLGGFSLADAECCGASIVVTADVSCHDDARVIAETLARQLWNDRSHLRIAATPLDVAIGEAVRATRGERSPVLLADVADNPGGGAPGTSTFVLQALLDAGVHDVVMGLHCDPEVVGAAFTAGVGASVDIEFNRASSDPLAVPLPCTARVLQLADDPFVPTRGVYAGSPRWPGRSCSLLIEGIQIGVSTRKVQCADDDTLRFVGLDPTAARVVVVKSRGHFRAGFDHLFADDQIIEVAAPGVATVALDTIVWHHLPRPSWPLDDIDGWEPEVHLAHAGVAS